MSHSKKRTKTTLIHRHVRIDDRPTSLALEPEFWQYLREIAYTRRVTLGTADFNTIHFDGSFIKCAELKEAIVEQKKLKITIAELRVTNTQTSEGAWLSCYCYCDCLIK